MPFIMKIYGFISELKEELKKGVFRFVFERKSRTERDDIQSINPSINPSVPEQKSEVQTALEIIAETKDRNGGKTDFSLCLNFQ